MQCAYSIVSAVRLAVVREQTLAYLGSDGRLGRPVDVAELLRRHIGDPDREHLVVVGVDVQLRPLFVLTAAIGTLDACPMHPREVFKAAVLHNCHGLFLGHNHPSGDPEPSREDWRVTERLVAAGKILGIEVLDYVIIAGDRHCSLRERGWVTGPGR